MDNENVKHGESLYEQRRRMREIIERKRIEREETSGKVIPPSTRMRTKDIVDRVEVMRQSLIIKLATKFLI